MEPESQKEGKSKPIEELEEQEKPISSGEELSEKEELISPESLHLELRSQQEKNLRLLAEMENTRQRMQKEKHQTTRFAIENVILDFLSVLDNLENALSFAKQASVEVQKWAKGFEMILGQFKEILSNHNVTPFSCEGDRFDPHLHDVLEIEETEKHQEETIIHEFSCGYRCGDRILRPAKVKVAKKPSQGGEETQVNEENKMKENIENDPEEK